MNAKACDILGVGVAAVDDLLLVEKFPGRNEKFPLLSLTRQGGGLTATALVAASRLGCSCRMVLALGGDELSNFLRKTLGDEGVVVIERPGLPGGHPFHCYVITEKGTGDRTIMWSEEGLFPLRLEPGDAGLVDSARCLFVDNIYAESLLMMADRARGLEIPIVGDFESTGEAAVLLMKRVDHLIMPLHHASRLTGEGAPERALARLMREPGRKLACVTDSERGSWYAEAGGSGEAVHQPAFAVERVVDTCGCGDVFHGAYAAALVQGYPVRERIRRASAAAAIKAGKQGSQNGAPTAGELESFLGGRGGMPPGDPGSGLGAQ